MEQECWSACTSAKPTGSRFMSRQRLFFATASDLLPGLQRFEDESAVRYIHAGLFDSPVPTEFAAGASLPNLGFAPSGDAVHEPQFLVMPRDIAVIVREVRQRSSGLKSVSTNAITRIRRRSNLVVVIRTTL